MDFARLAEQNPWWHDPAAIEGDFHVRAFDSSPVRWEPREAEAFSFDADVVYTLRGPRQVGKTTLLKLLVRRLLRVGWRPERLCYLSCDLIDDYRELADAVRAYLAWARRRVEPAVENPPGAASPSERLAVFLDEVTYVDRWQRAVKHLWDLGLLQGVTVIVTGSHALDIRRGAELLPGRRGERADVDHLLLPLDFGGFWDATRSGTPADLPSLDEDSLWELARGGSEGLLPFAAWAAEAEGAMADFLLSGGFPLSVRHLREAGIPPHVFQTYLHWVRGDFLKLGKSEEYLRAVIARIIEVLSTPVSWQDLASGTALGSHHTVQDYVEALEASFVVRTVYRYNPAKDTGFLGKNRKLYFTDPFLYHAFRAWIRGATDPFALARGAVGEPALAGKLMEATVIEHALRRFPGRVYYWRNRAEVDLAVKTRHGLVPIEVKYQGTVGPHDVRPLKHLGGGILVSRGTFAVLDGVPVLPTALFLALLSGRSQPARGSASRPPSAGQKQLGRL